MCYVINVAVEGVLPMSPCQIFTDKHIVLSLIDAQSGLPLVREKSGKFKVREKSVNFVLGQRNLRF